MFQTFTLENSLLGPMSTWTNVFFDLCPLDKVVLGQLSLGQMYQHPHRHTQIHWQRSWDNIDPVLGYLCEVRKLNKEFSQNIWKKSSRSHWHGCLCYSYNLRFLHKIVCIRCSVIRTPGRYNVWWKFIRGWYLAQNILK